MDVHKVWYITWFFTGMLIWYHIHKHPNTQHTQGPVDWHTHINIYLHHLLCAHSSYLYYSKWLNEWLTDIKNTPGDIKHMSGDTLTPTPYFKTTLPFTNPSIFMEKIWTSSFFQKFWKLNQGSGGWGNNYALTCSS